MGGGAGSATIAVQKPQGISHILKEREQREKVKLRNESGRGGNGEEAAG